MYDLMKGTEKNRRDLSNNGGPDRPKTGNIIIVIPLGFDGL